MKKRTGECAEVEVAGMSVDQLRQRFLTYLKSEYLSTSRRSRLAVALALAGLGLLILAMCAALGVWQAAGMGAILTAIGSYRTYHLQRPLRAYRRIRRVVENGAPVTAYVVQANERLWVPAHVIAPALVIFSFELRGDDSRFMHQIVQELQMLKGTSPTDPELAALAQRITSEKAEIDARQRLPAQLTDGAVVYMGDVYVYSHRLRQKYIDRPALVCLAESGDQGGIEQLPDWLVDEAISAPTRVSALRS